MRVRILAVGRMRHAALRAACDEYHERLGHYLSFAVREVREAGRPDRDADRARRTEGEALLREAADGARILALTREGEAVDSTGLARILAGWQRDARDVDLVLGGAHGLDAAVLDAAEQRLSLSHLTLPHDLARLVLLEQLYRACTILRGEPYHKGGRR
jgi:23S rRNA (pseudouridine1915-N3)-methyltransferase